jgi:hypothetical protein
MTPGAVKGLGFYEAAAQIIPVLVLVVLLELRLARPSRWPGGPADHWAKVGFWFVGITCAEAVALITLYTEEPNWVTAVGVAFPLFLLWLLILYGAVRAQPSPRSSAADESAGGS